MQPASSHAAPASHYRVADNVNRGPRPLQILIGELLTLQPLPSTNRSARQQLDQNLERPRSGHFIVHNCSRILAVLEEARIASCMRQHSPCDRPPTCRQQWSAPTSPTAWHTIGSRRLTALAATRRRPRAACGRRRRAQPSGLPVMACCCAGLTISQQKDECTHAQLVGRSRHVAAIGLYMATLASPWPPVAPSTPTLLVRGGSLPVSTA